MRIRTISTALLLVSIAAIIAAAQQPSQVLGKTNLQGWIDDAPGLPNSLEDALARKNGSGGSFYQPFYDKVEAFKKAYKQAIAGRAKPDEAAMRKAAEAQANSIPMIAQLGGIEKLAQMSPEQRAQAVRLMMQSTPQSPVVVPSGRTSSNEAATTSAVNRDLQLMVQQRGTLDTAFATRDAEITNSKGSHEEINQDASAKLAKIPMVNDSIMGRVHDLEQEAALNKETAGRHRDRANWELQQRTALFTDQQLKLKALASSYQNWLKNNQDKVNASTAPADLLRGTNTEIAVAEYEQSFVDAAYDLAKYSEAVTRDIASYQERSQQGTAAIRRHK